MMISALPGERERETLPANMHILPEMSFDTCSECGQKILLIDLQSCRVLSPGFYGTSSEMTFYVKEAPPGTCGCAHPTMEIVYNEDD